MALGDAYATLDEFKSYARVTDTVDDTEIQRVINSASRAVERFCGRQFNKVTEASARQFDATTRHTAWVDDFHTTEGLVIKIDTGDNGTYETTVSSSDYVLRPLNGRSVEGIEGWPFHRIELDGSGRYFPVPAKRPQLEITAQWGWSAVPDPVKHATLIKSAQVFGRRSSPHGQAVIGTGDFVFRISRQADPDVAELLAPYAFVVPSVA